MKNASSRRGVLPVPEPGSVRRRRLRSEPSPTLAGLPGRPWRPQHRTQDEILARPVPPSGLRLAHDPLGRGWLRRKAVCGAVVPARSVKVKSSERARRPVVRRGGIAGQVDVPPSSGSIEAVTEVGADSFTRQSGAVSRSPVQVPSGRSEGTDEPSWGGPVAARARARRIELIPAAPSLPRILFTGDAPPPGFEVTETPASPVIELAPPAVQIAGEPTSTVGAAGAGFASSRLTDAPGEVWLTARDPFTVVAHWEREIPEPEAPEREWGRGRWWMRLHEGSAEGPVVTERPATEAAGTVLLPVIQAGQKYVAELGYDSHRSGWHGVAISHPVPTPPDRPSVVPEAPARVQWGTVAPWEGEPGLGHSVGFVEVSAPVSVSEPRVGPGSPIVRTEETWEDEPAEVTSGAPGGALRWSWTLWSGDGLLSSGVVAVDAPELGDGGGRKGRRVRTESIGGLPEGLSDLDLGAGSSEELTAAPLSSGRRGFWFRLNAEVILHGSTEPDARVTIAGRPVALRPDGSFSFRFAFPDGDFRLPVEAISADRMDGRKATVRFLRATALEGEVGVHPVPPAWDAALEDWGA